MTNPRKTWATLPFLWVTDVKEMGESHLLLNLTIRGGDEKKKRVVEEAMSNNTGLLPVNVVHIHFYSFSLFTYWFLKCWYYLTITGFWNGAASH